MHDPLHDEHREADLDRAAGFLRDAGKVSVLTGAGISAESGVATFRGAGGLWEGHRVEEVATPDAFERDPELVWRFYNQRRKNLWPIKPNPGHFVLADFERRWGCDHFAICTQNIDGLHRAAGSSRVLELHGNLTRVRCKKCPFNEPRPGEDLPDLPRCPQCGHLLRPDVVWFHEALPQDVWYEAVETTMGCGCFVVVGTSAVVYPAAGLVDVARGAGAKVIEINLDESAVSSRVDVSLRGKSGEILPRLAAALDSPDTKA